MEPFIIATRRQLSTMHPIYKLLHPHFKDTMHINSLARGIVLNSGGILERTVYTGKFSLEISSQFYREWKFHEKALPVDLLKRGMAVEDPDNPAGVRLLLEDYPFAVDGLDIWTAINAWVRDFCSYFYTSNSAVASDDEIQSWWWEIKHVGHGDKVDEDWLFKMDCLSDLIQTLTILIWISSAFHAAVNFGQYAYAGFPLNRPTLCRKFIPRERSNEFVKFLKDPDQYLLHMVSDRFTTSLGLALIEVLSSHMSEEKYLGQIPQPEWTEEDEIRKSFERFRENLRAIERRILRRNESTRWKNRWGPSKMGYTLLFPDTSNVGSTWGITGKGIPNSISI